MTEYEKMMAGEVYNAKDPGLLGDLCRVVKTLEPKTSVDPLLEELFALFCQKGYTAEDFYGGCALCGDANDFALDIIDEAVLKAMPEGSKFDRNRRTSALYSALHRRFEAEEQQ